MVAEIRNPAADRLEITQDELIKRADEIFKLAMASGQLGAAENALKELGILSGKRIERAERGESGEFDRMSDDEITASRCRSRRATRFYPQEQNTLNLQFSRSRAIRPISTWGRGGRSDGSLATASAISSTFMWRSIAPTGFFG